MVVWRLDLGESLRLHVVLLLVVGDIRKIKIGSCYVPLIIMHYHQVCVYHAYLFAMLGLLLFELLLASLLILHLFV